jgi:hypothetical protein
MTKPALQQIFDNLSGAGFTLVGPRVTDGAIVIDEIERLDELPIGWTDEQAPGSYRLHQSHEPAYFSFNAGAHSWKPYLNPPRTRLFGFQRTRSNPNGSGHHEFSVESADGETPRYAMIGVRACDLSAIGIQDRVFMAPEVNDPVYGKRRRELFVLAVNCTKAGSNCFCTSMKCGPKATTGFDLAFTELPDIFVVEIGSEAGSEALRDTFWDSATAYDQGRATQALQMTERNITKHLQIEGLPELMFSNLDHQQWKDVATRCLACGNCTMVCPTCFCSTVEDKCDLSGVKGERERVWDSCFAASFSHVHGGNLRPTLRSRYRQWLTHKFASWQGQFGTLGCVGCGRCITWCPVGIDVTEELKAIQATGAK